MTGRNFHAWTSHKTVLMKRYEWVFENPSTLELPAVLEAGVGSRQPGDKDRACSAPSTDVEGELLQLLGQTDAAKEQLGSRQSVATPA